LGKKKLCKKCKKMQQNLGRPRVPVKQIKSLGLCVWENAGGWLGWQVGKEGEL